MSGSSPRVRGKRAGVAQERGGGGLIPARAGKTAFTSAPTPRSWAHPRACGENFHFCDWPPMPRGSSPRVRGKPVGERGRCFAGGLIPARAGKTQRACLPASTRTAHPRACGENHGEVPATRQPRGSSPRVRGKLVPARPLRPLLGLIPARAGKTRRTTLAPGPPGAHPRACGENAWLNSSAVISPGSSPRVRGKRKPPRSRGRVGRLIPARAGKTVDRVHAGLQSRAHPRACGENNAGVSGNASILGSSPRVRGKWQRPRPVHLRGRLIPARAGKTSPPRTSWCSGTAHPRACGENPDRQCGTARSRGSSPRVRGKPDRLRALADDLRLIPARAGKTRCTHARVPPLRAHPRACGENGKLTAQLHEGSGSSPRVRGKLDATGGVTSFFGLIPARAGKTPRPQWLSGRPRAHPRACGENSRTSAPRSDCSGSSPRVRGKLISFSASCGVCGLIPARAGKTLGLTQGQITRRAHPRACGENGRIGVPVSLASGSSPRVRGKRTSTVSPSLTTGLIPARAGTTRSVCAAARRERAHPRACGENVASASEWGGTTGSSPRVRGKPHRAVLHRHDARLIPARAGKTVHEVGRDPGPRAHPRACGENDGGIVGSVLGWGSSPRVRGKREVDEPGRPGGGLIPARAGKTSSPSVGSPEPSAHPRACGENLMRRRAEARASGSSPRVRGKPGWWPRAPRESGLIPARAGKTRASTPWRRTRRAHPRACGENRM